MKAPHPCRSANKMISQKQAEEIVLDKVNQEREHTQIIYSSYLAEEKDFWVISANSELFIKQNLQEYCYVGVNAYLVETTEGDIYTVGSAQVIEEVLKDIRDLKTAGTKVYVLKSNCQNCDMDALKKFREVFSCGIKRSKELLVGEKKNWVRGKKSFLEKVQTYLKNQSIETKIELQEKDLNIPKVEESHKLENTIEGIKDYFNQK